MPKSKLPKRLMRRLLRQQAIQHNLYVKRCIHRTGPQKGDMYFGFGRENTEVIHINRYFGDEKLFDESELFVCYLIDDMIRLHSRDEIRMLANNIRKCSCYMCKSNRRSYRGSQRASLTLQEVSNAEKFETGILDVETDPEFDGIDIINCQKICRTRIARSVPKEVYHGG